MMVCGIRLDAFRVCGTAFGAQQLNDEVESRDVSITKLFINFSKYGVVAIDNPLRNILIPALGRVLDEHKVIAASIFGMLHDAVVGHSEFD